MKVLEAGGCVLGYWVITCIYKIKGEVIASVQRSGCIGHGMLIRSKNGVSRHIYTISPLFDLISM